MRAAVISDIHSNLPALEAVLESIDHTGVDEIWCLGDVVGYGAQPDGCADLVRERCSICLVGNHDLAALERLDVSSFSSAAATAVSWTQEAASKETMEFLEGARARRPSVRESASFTPRPATRSGNTCCRPTRPRTAWTSSPSAWR